jgi:hypothetical protein
MLTPKARNVVINLIIFSALSSATSPLIAYSV